MIILYYSKDNLKKIVICSASFVKKLFLCTLRTHVVILIHCSFGNLLTGIRA